jgi:DNA-binding MarR family transcriptional regulator
VDRLLELAPSVRRAFEVRLSEERAQWLSLTGHQLEALAALKEGSLTMRSLCERLDISESAGTALSDRLVARGMVARETDPSDRRVVRLTLTEQARAMVERYRQLKSHHAAQLLSTLSEDDLERLVQIYETLVSASPTVSAPTSRAASTETSDAGRTR